MIFNINQIQQLLGIIEKNHIIYGAYNIGTDILSDYDKQVLKQYGIDVDKLKTDYTPFEQSFYWGRLSQALSNYQANQVLYSDFIKYLRYGQYIPLTSRENSMLNIAKARTYGHIKDLGKNMGSDVNSIILEKSREKAIKEELERGITERRSLQGIVSEIGHRTGDWQRNLGRIVDTEYNTIFQQGRAEQLKREYGDDVMVYKDVYPGACRHCIRLYLTGGIGSKPIVFKLKTLEANGTNVGKKVADWKATVGSTHPHCRCNLHYFDTKKVWDDDKNDFVYPDNYKPMERKKNKLTVGNKVFWV